MSGHALNDMLTEETKRAHRARWYVWSGGQKLRHTASMRGYWPGYDVECSCGAWASKTGGATRSSVEEALWQHRYDAQVEGELHAEVRPLVTTRTTRRVTTGSCWPRSRKRAPSEG